MTLFSVSNEHKQNVVRNIEKANSKAYRAQKLSHAVVSTVLDDMMNDPQWRADLEVYASQPRKNDKVKTGFSFLDAVKAVLQ